MADFRLPTPGVSPRLALRLFAGILALWIAAGFAGAWTTLHPPREALGPTPAQRGMDYSNVSFRTSDGLTLRGWWIPGNGHQTVVMIHGLSSNRREPFDKSGYLHDAGYNVLVFDLRGHGESDGYGTTMGYRETEDVRAAVREAQQLDSGPIALFGYSLGAAVALEEAATDPTVAAVIEDSGFSSLGDVFVSRFAELTKLPGIPFAAATVAFGTIDVGTSLWKVAPAASAARLRAPLLTIISGGDTTVPPAQGFAIYEAAAGPKRMLYVPTAGHVHAYDAANRLYTSTVLEFLAENLKPKTP